MHTKNRTGVVSETRAQAALRRGAAPDLTAEEESVVRMRLGAPLPRTAPLERKAGADADLAIELLAYEIEAFMKWRDHLSRVRAAAPPPPRAAQAVSRTKEKIVRALRKKP